MKKILLFIFCISIVAMLQIRWDELQFIKNVSVGLLCMFCMGIIACVVIYLHEKKNYKH